MAEYYAYLKSPYPCAHGGSTSGCTNFHDDEKSGLCPEHRGGGGGGGGGGDGGGGGVCRLCSLSPAAAHRMKKRNEWFGVAFITVSMGIVESNDKVVLALTGSAFTVIAAANAYKELYGDSVAAAWAVAVMLVLAVGSLVYRGRLLTGKIEDMEETAKL